ncbi:hypothetical protein [Cupriavidus campinensis]|uniref:DUF2059 domain-containing protein n=1 Tax=Cupriavidus campinensis TaxID=151783 RepID=A0ABY3ETX9_9BURK|nr:hypothetical protein [Cupriavidus campinensis]TSP14033.1 hypothetical protein FGG12_06065 [Cupriavidus campinensis]
MSELAQAINAAVAELGGKVEPVEGAEPGAFGDPLPTPAELQAVPSMDADKLKELARAFLRGEVFTDRQIARIEDMRLVFLPIMFGALAAVDLKTIGLVYEYHREAGPRRINGMPIFLSMRLLNREDAAKLADYATKLAAAEKAAMAALED